MIIRKCDICGTAINENSGFLKFQYKGETVDLEWYAYVSRDDDDDANSCSVAFDICLDCLTTGAINRITEEQQCSE